MAFNFNWAPLTTSNTSSSAFYSHAKSLLTAALNKSQKPPIIVDDIFVEELNLGQSAPELEILEIGDLAEDRFRGIFRMSYDGDAFLTLKTKVQANPLNTYLSTTPSYTSPMPLAASSPLTIPLQITLSQFRLSGFIILVFSKAKGITLVFRNDPLESLKVSSTFDTIPFIKEYLQNEIERQVRGLFQEELPVAVHRLSLRLWNPEYAASLGLDTQDACPTSPTDGLEDDIEDDAAAAFVNPLLSPSDTSDTPSITFSQKNLAALRDLSESQRTLAVSTPSISDAVFRAWASGGGNSALWDRSGTVEPPGTPISGPQTYTFSDNGDAVSTGAYLSSRPALNPSSSSQSLSAAAISGRSRGKKRKHRVVNLRSMKETPISAEPTTPPTPGQEPTKAKPEEEISSPRSEPFVTPSTSTSPCEGKVVFESPAPPSPPLAAANTASAPALPSGSTEKARSQAGTSSPISSGILEQAFMRKLAGEMERRLEGERRKRSVSVGSGKIWREVERELREISRNPEAPPAYRQ